MWGILVWQPWLEVPAIVLYYCIWKLPIITCNHGWSMGADGGGVKYVTSFLSPLSPLITPQTPLADHTQAIPSLNPLVTLVVVFWPWWWQKSAHVCIYVTPWPDLMGRPNMDLLGLIFGQTFNVGLMYIINERKSFKMHFESWKIGFSSSYGCKNGIHGGEVLFFAPWEIWSKMLILFGFLDEFPWHWPWYEFMSIFTHFQVSGGRPYGD